MTPPAVLYIRDVTHPQDRIGEKGQVRDDLSPNAVADLLASNHVTLVSDHVKPDPEPETDGDVQHDPDPAV